MSTEQGRTRLEEELRAAVRIFASSISPARQVVADMSALVRITAVLPLSNLSYWERLIRDEFLVAWRAEAHSKNRGWRALFAPSVRAAKDAQSGRHLTWIDLSSHDGYGRERALRTISGPAPNAFFFALAAKRLNDWVPQVRAAARETVPVLARASDPECVAHALCALLPTWTSWGRLLELDKRVVPELVSIERVAESLKRQLISSAAGPMSAVMSQALRAPTLDQHLVEIATKAIQPSVRARAYKALILGKAVWVEGRQWQWTDVRYCQGRLNNVLSERLLSTPVLPEFLSSAAADRSSIVRRVAAEALVREMSSLGNIALPLARQLAGDSSSAVAERGAFVLKQLGV